jgi:hypothetical protein
MAFWVTGDGAGRATDYTIEGAYVEKASAFVYWGISNNNVRLERFTCFYVLACTQSAGAVGAAYAKYNHRENEFLLVRDPLGSDDGIALFDDLYGADIGPGCIWESTPVEHWQAHYSGNAITIQTSASGVVSEVSLHDIIIKKSGGLSYGSGKAIDPNVVNPNKSGIVVNPDAAGTIDRLHIRNVMVDGGYYGLYLHANNNADRITNSSVENVLVRNTTSRGVHLDGLKDPRITNLRIEHCCQYIGAAAFNTERLSNFVLSQLSVTGGGTSTGLASAGWQFGVTMSGQAENVRARGFSGPGGTGFYIAPFATISGPLSLSNLWSEGNDYGYDTRALATTNGLYFRNFGGRNNATALYRTDSGDPVLATGGSAESVWVHSPEAILSSPCLHAPVKTP